MGWKQVAKQKRDVRAAEIDKGLKGSSLPDGESTLNKYTKASGSSLSHLVLPGFLPNVKHLHSVDSAATEIVQHIQNRDNGWTATAVIKAYIQRASVAQKDLNCLTESTFTLTYLETRRILNLW